MSEIDDQWRKNEQRAFRIITDAWEGIEMFFEPGVEILVARDGGEVTALLRSLTSWVDLRILTLQDQQTRLIACLRTP